MTDAERIEGWQGEIAVTNAELMQAMAIFAREARGIPIPPHAIGRLEFKDGVTVFMWKSVRKEDVNP